MLSNLNAAQKGYLIVVVPLLFELAFIVMFAVVIVEGMRRFDALDHSRAGVTALFTAAAGVTEAILFVVSPDVTDDQARLDKLHRTEIGAQRGLGLKPEDYPELANPIRQLQGMEQRVVEIIQEAEEVIASPTSKPAKKRRPISHGKLFGLFNDSQPLTMEIEEAERRSMESQPRKFKQIEDLLLLAVIGGTGISIALSGTLSYMFSKDLIVRVRDASVAAQSLALEQPVTIDDPGRDELAQLNHALRQASTQLRDYRRVELAILDQSADVICSLDENFRVSICGKSTLSLWGLNPEDVRGRSILSMCPEDSVASTRTNLLLARTNRVVQFQNVMLTQQARPINCDWRVKWSSQQKTFNCVVRNIDDAIRVAEEKKMFVSAVCHDIRSPLTALRLSLGILLAEMRGPVPQSVRSKLGGVDALAQDLNRLVEDLLLSSRLSAGRLSLNIEPIELSVFCEEELQELFDRYPNVAVVGPVKATLENDPSFLRRLFCLLLEGASREMVPRSAFKAHLTIGADAADLIVQLSCRCMPGESTAVFFGQVVDADSDAEILNPTVSLLRAVVAKLSARLCLESLEPEARLTIRVPRNLMENA